ncbi:MAG: MBL fold metallo-hydrolase [Acidobacteria bacterium]|nr:MAG: MBL fold metallo-hydrolase [Acidobacteriota bacterium]
MVTTLDVGLQGRQEVVAAGLIEGPAGIAVVDPGPSSSLPGLEAGLARMGHSLDEIGAVLVTHIHLDHSGAAGTIVRRNPRARVYVHERGAAHVVDPGKLVASATRLYGDAMERLWGEIAPVPSDRVHALRGGETIEVAGLPLEVAYTPGHAVHHVSYFEAGSGTAFAGDTAGIRIAPWPAVVPPTPPPDIDVELWAESIRRLRAWRPSRLFLTHFGPFEDVEHHLDDLERRLASMAAMVRQSLEEPAADDDARITSFTAALKQSLREGLRDEAAAARYERAVPFAHCWAGLARYWRKKMV